MTKLWCVATLCVSMIVLGCFQEVVHEVSIVEQPQALQVYEVRSPDEVHQLMHSAPTYNDGIQYDPVALIRVVNELIKCGRGEAIRMLTEYLAACESNGQRLVDPSGTLKVLTICRILFTPEEAVATRGELHLGAPLYGELPEVVKQWPDYPFLLYDDVPVLVESEFILAGGMNDVQEYLAYCASKCAIRQKPLVPRRPPCEVVEHVIGVLASSGNLNAVTLLQANRLLKWQALNALRSVPGWNLDKDPLDSNNWLHYTQIEKQLELCWSVEARAYVPSR